MYIATFFTHFGAISFNKFLTKQGQNGVLSPVPRAISASCGVCVKFESIANIDFENLKDISEIYSCKNGEYELLYSNE